MLRTCQDCGYVMSDFDIECERCWRRNHQSSSNPSEQARQSLREEREHSGVASIFIEEWSWGAFAFSWLWCVSLCPRYWGLFFALDVMLFPLLPISLIWRVWIGINGHKIAWRHGQFNSITEFKGIVEVWNKFGAILCFATGGIAALYLVILLVSILLGAVA